MNKLQKMPFLAMVQEPTKGRKSWYAEVPNVNGCFTTGETFGEVKDNIMLALHTHTRNKALGLSEVMNMDVVNPEDEKGYIGWHRVKLTTDVYVVRTGPLPGME